MVLEDAKENQAQIPFIYAPTETLTCRICGKEYTSRGKYDPGYCQECANRVHEINAQLVGGPLG